MRFSSLTPRLLIQARKCLTFPSNMLLTHCGHTGYQTKGALLGDRPKGSSQKYLKTHLVLSTDPHLDPISLLVPLSFNELHPKVKFTSLPTRKDLALDFGPSCPRVSRCTFRVDTPQSRGRGHHP